MASSECVKVMVRVRPMNSSERARGCTKVVQVLNKINMIKITKPDNSSQTKQFTYDGVFAQDSTQQQVYDDAAFSLIQSVLEGYNGTIFAYGQTGCGKTHTMVGVKNDPSQNGIIPKAFQHIFGCIDAATDDKRFLVRCSFLEIYNEGIHDLLGNDGSKKLALKEDPQKGIFVKDLTYTICSNVDEIDKIMQAGSQNRHTGETLMNKDSSRSHSIFSIYIEMAELAEDGENQKIRAGKLNLVDLAGSERQSKTHATGDRLNEANKINLSLSALGNVISALVDGKSTHIPYRDSKLTRLLQDSLGGNTKTIMIAAVSPAHYNYDETLSTLRYASRAKSIKNKPHINEDPKDALLREYENEIKKLKEMISMYEGGNGANPTEAKNQIANALMKLQSHDQSNLLSGLDQSGEIIIIDKKTGKAKMRKKNENGDLIEIDVEQSFDFPYRRGSFVSNSGQPVRRQSETKAKLLEREKEIEQLNKDREEIQNELKSREEKLMAEQQQKMTLEGMMQHLEQKLVRGGAALNEEQKKHAMAYRELQLKLKKQKKKEKQLIMERMKKDDEMLMVEQNYKDLQQESEQNRKNLKKLRNKYKAAVDEIKDLEQEHERNREDLLDTIRDNERQLKLYKTMVHMLMNEDDVQKVLKRCVWNESDGEWTVPQFMFKNRKVQFPTIKNAESIVQNYKDSQELVISDNQNPKPKSKWASDGGHYPSASPRVHSSQNRLNGPEQFLPTKFSFENREAIINKFTSNLKNVAALQGNTHYSNVPDPTLLHTDIALVKEDERILKPKHQRGKVQLQPILKLPQGGKKSAQDRFISKQASNSSIVIPKPSGHRVGSLEKIENPPHLKKITQLQPIGASIGQNNRIDFSFKATFVLEHQDSGEDMSGGGSAHKISRGYHRGSPGLSSKNVVASYIQHPNQQEEQ